MEPGDTPIEKMLISRPRVKTLTDSDLHTVGDVAAYSDAELLRIPNFGIAALAEVRSAQDRILGTVHDRSSWSVKMLPPVQAFEREIMPVLAKYAARLSDREIREIIDRLLPARR